MYVRLYVNACCGCFAYGGAYHVVFPLVVDRPKTLASGPIWTRRTVFRQLYVYGWFLGLALPFLRCRHAHDARHHVQYGPEGQFCCLVEAALFVVFRNGVCIAGLLVTLLGILGSTVDTRTGVSLWCLSCCCWHVEIGHYFFGPSYLVSLVQYVSPEEYTIWIFLMMSSGNVPYSSYACFVSGYKFMRQTTVAGFAGDFSPRAVLSSSWAGP